MGSPKSYRRGRGSTFPPGSLTKCNDTTHRQGSDERESWHSVGHLCTQGFQSKLYGGWQSLLPCASARGTGEGNTRYGLNEGRLARALRPQDSDNRYVKV
jgi:hypothetical protein